MAFVNGSTVGLMDVSKENRFRSITRNANELFWKRIERNSPRHDNCVPLVCFREGNTIAIPLIGTVHFYHATPFLVRPNMLSVNRTMVELVCNRLRPILMGSLSCKSKESHWNKHLCHCNCRWYHQQISTTKLTIHHFPSNLNWMLHCDIFVCLPWISVGYNLCRLCTRYLWLRRQHRVSAKCVSLWRTCMGHGNRTGLQLPAMSREEKRIYWKLQNSNQFRCRQKAQKSLNENSDWTIRLSQDYRMWLIQF